jgi:DNA-binding transcriptional LysR family regulator
MIAARIPPIQCLLTFEALAMLQKFPSSASAPGQRKLCLAVTPTVARSLLNASLREPTEAYPEIDQTIQTSIPLTDAVPEDADLMIRYRSGRYANLEHICLVTNEVAPVAWPAFVCGHGRYLTAARPAPIHADCAGVPA